MIPEDVCLNSKSLIDTEEREKEKEIDDFKTYFYILSICLILEPSTNTEIVLREATMKIHAKYDLFETTLQIEEFHTDMEECNECTNPA